MYFMSKYNDFADVEINLVTQMFQA